MGYQTRYGVLTWRVEYKTPGGAWTFLARESVASTGSPTLSRTYNTPRGVEGAWSIRAILESSGSISSVSGAGLKHTGNDDIVGKATSRYKRSYYIDLPSPGPWDIRVTRNTPDSTSSSLRNETWWDSLAEIVESKLSYPNSSVFGITFDAEQFSNIPTRGYEIYGILCQVPTNYDPVARTYTGTWDGKFKTVWTNNPVWIYYDILTAKRYGLGSLIDVAGIDKWALYEIGQYCDEMVPSGYGYLEPRFTCNCYIQTREDAYKLLASLTSVFRGMAYWSAGQVTAVADMPSDPIALFTNANVIDGAFSYAGSSRAVRHTVALVTWNNPDNAYAQEVEYVDDIEGIKLYGVNQTEVVAFGCTSRGQAHRYGKHILYTERLESEVVSWKTGLEGVSVYPGAIVTIADNLHSGDRIGGRSLGATINTITLDAPVTLAPALTYTLSVVLPEGGVSDHTITNSAGSTSEISVTPDFPAIPQLHSMWVIASANLSPQTVRILSVSESGKTQIEITALQHDPNKFAMIEYDRKFQAKTISSISSLSLAPSVLAASDTLYLQGPGVVGTKCHFSWISNAVRFDVKWRQNLDNYKALPSTTNYVDIAPVVDGPISLQVRAIDSIGRTSSWSALDYSVLGKSVPPVTPTGFTSYVTDAGIVLSWEPNADLDLAGYQISVNDGIEDTVTATQWAYPHTPAGITNFSIRAVDTSGNLSAPGTTSCNIVPPGMPDLKYHFAADQVILEIVKPVSQLSVDHYEIRWGAAWDTGISMGKVYATTFQILGTWGGDRLFWIAATDIGGNTSAAQSIPVTIIPPCMPPSVSIQVIDNNALLYWGESSGSLTVATYEIRRGATWETATSIGKKSGGFTTIFETSSGAYTYWVSAIDTAGNYSAPNQRAATISQPPDYILKVSSDSEFAGTFSNAKVDIDGSIILPVNLTETFQQHFDNNAWTSPQSQSMAGCPVYAQPGAGSGYYEEVIDLGQVLSAIKITLSYSGLVVSGAPTVITTISTKRLIGDAWVDNVGVSQFYGSSFQFVKARIAISGATGTIYRITSINTKLDAKLKSDAGMTSCLLTDTLGTIANFNSSFIDVTSIGVSPQGTTPISVAYDAHDAIDSVTYSVASKVVTVTHIAHPYVTGQYVSVGVMTGTLPSGTYAITSTTTNSYTLGTITTTGYTAGVTAANTSGTSSIYPESMRIYLFNSTTGARVSGQVSWTIKGY